MYGEAELYVALKEKLLTIKELKRVDMFNNQFEHEKEEKQMPMPCAFIQLATSNFEDVGGARKIQKKICIATIHLGYESKKDSDTEILKMKQRIYGEVHGFRIIKENENEDSTVGVLKRVDERQNTEHDNLYVFETDYGCYIMDYEADKTIIKTLTDVNIDIQPSLTDEIE